MQHGVHGTGRTKSVSSRPVTAIVRSSQFSEPSVSSSAVASTPPWARPGAPWWAGLHGELGGDAHALAGPRREVQPVRLALAAAETVLVVRAEELAGGGGVRVPHRGDGVGRGCQSC